jgi:iron complex outermembrane receptor protein
VLFDFYTGKNSKNLVVSPQYVSFLRLFNKQGKFDIYNELIYKSSYSAMQLDMGASFDYTFALKYHKTKDLSFGLRGENIFHDSFEQVYKFYNQAIPVNDQKFWINMEYLF